MIVPLWAAVLILVVSFLAAIGLTIYLVLDYLKRKRAQEEAATLRNRPPEISMTTVVADKNYSRCLDTTHNLTIYTHLTITTLDVATVLWDWIKCLITLWSDEDYPATPEQVKAALAYSNIAITPHICLTTPTGLASGICYYPAKLIYITGLSKKNKPRDLTSLKSLFLHEASHLVLFYTYPKLNGETHHEIFKSKNI